MSHHQPPHLRSLGAERDADPLSDSARRRLFTPYVRVTRDWHGMFCDFRARYGRFRNAAMLGVAPLTWSHDWSQSFTTLRFERFGLVVTWEWQGENLQETQSDEKIDRPQSMPLASRPDGSVVMYDWFTNRVLPIRRSGDTLWVGAQAARLERPARLGRRVTQPHQPFLRH